MNTLNGTISGIEVDCACKAIGRRSLRVDIGRAAIWSLEKFYSKNYLSF